MNLTLENLSKKYPNGKHANKNIQLALSPGIYGLLGPNGAGKTTLMKMIATVQQPTQGRILLNGTDILAKPAAMRRVLGYLPQIFGTYEHLTANEFLLYVAAMKGISPKAAKHRIESILNELNLAAVAKKRISTYSGGMKQRIGIAQAILNDPKVLIFDEPTVGLDPEERVRFRNLISELSQKAVVLLSTHIVSDVDSVADKVLVMKEGEIVRQGTQQEVVESTLRYVYEQEQTAGLPLDIPKSCIINTMRKHDRTIVRFWQDAPIDGTDHQQPTLEDAYLVLSKTEK